MSFWREIDWGRPWLAPYRGHGEAVCAALERGCSVAEALNGCAPVAVLWAGRLRFVAQHELPEGEAYEAFIHRTACVPTRDNLHDLFNGLVWLSFPRIKQRLNELQAAEIAKTGVQAWRGSLRDALTLFDENAALWRASDELREALRLRDWPSLFVRRREAWASASLILFGHALLEKLVHPRAAITAHVWAMPPGTTDDEFIDASLNEASLRAKPWLPMPVLGVPGWWAANEDAGFYDDASVFRPDRTFSPP
ncbi:DUF3025 domain-containing protein [Piscinibacter terrae]|uniref:DUF3025 domain-containing protein n=1 Tax=Piscinibacter terrae TaxID=2496871 RepID=A0A3N7HH74_9BURK|nr:DUF3025 domain-containing protein [Albitalea terrae]RQP21387.1 DUF3025 domain-containing protein [Albitalea terrae]